MNYSKLNTLEAIGLLSIIMANKIILNLPEQIISSTGSAAGLNCIYIIILVFVFIAIIFKLIKRFPCKDIIDISQYIGGHFLKTIIGIVQIILLFFIASSIIRNFSYTVKTIYFTSTPTIYISIFIILPVIISNKCGLKSISKICLYILPIAYVRINYFIACSNKRL